MAKRLERSDYVGRYSSTVFEPDRLITARQIRRLRYALKVAGRRC